MHLTTGEFVMNHAAAHCIGPAALHRISCPNEQAYTEQLVALLTEHGIPLPPRT